MTLRVARADPREPEATALVTASHALMTALFPPEANLLLPVSALCGPDVAFFLARSDGRAVGCAALARRDGYAEIKSLFVAPEARQAGVGAALLAHLEAAARADRVAMLRLETGTTLTAARALYTRAGFVPCGPFGPYAANLHSVFLQKPLSS